MTQSAPITDREFAVGTGAAGTTLAWLSAMNGTLPYPTSNFDGYAVAQILASKVHASAVIHPTALSKLIALIGGPKVAAILLAVCVAVAAMTFFRWLSSFFRKISARV